MMMPSAMALIRQTFPEPRLRARAVGAMVSPPATAVLLDAVPEHGVGTASGVFNTSRQLGGALAVAVFGGLLAGRGSFVDGVRISLLLGAAVLAAAAATSLRLAATPLTPQPNHLRRHRDRRHHTHSRPTDVGDFAPAPVEFTDDVLFGQMWSRNEPSQERSLVTAASLPPAAPPPSSSTA